MSPIIIHILIFILDKPHQNSHSGTFSQLSKNQPDRATDKDVKETNLKPRILKNSRVEDVLSPIPVHNEIEVFHNLTRSPDRSRRNSAVLQHHEPGIMNNNLQLSNVNNVESILVTFPPEKDKNTQVMKVKQEVQKQQPETKTYNSFTVFEGEKKALMVSKSDKSSVIIEKVTQKDVLNPVPNGKKPSLQQSLSSLTSDVSIYIFFYFFLLIILIFILFIYLFQYFMLIMNFNLLRYF